jgi:predicted PurR-regulated permease PerM
MMMLQDGPLKSPFFTSLLLANILAPRVIRLEGNLKLGRIGGTMFLYLNIFMIIFILAAFLVYRMFQELSWFFEAIMEEVPKLLASLSENTSLKLDSEFIQNFKEQTENSNLIAKHFSLIFPAIKNSLQRN